MEIYKAEIEDGLGDLLSSTNSVAYCGVAKCFTPSTEEQESMKLIASEASENKDQIDLFYLESVLVSTGWNKNDDVFDPKETFAARTTPEDKPFNFMHNEKDIIGHITGNRVVDFQGNAIAEETENPPTEFNILTTAVIYKEWSDVDQRQRIQKILAEIEEGKWFVSMECLFPSFDYALVDKTGGTRVVPREESSAFLTKHLRSYGGSGKYEDYRVGRLLRNLSFSGKGLVSKPANPRSVILEGNRFFDESEAQILTISSIKENDMSDLDKQIDDLRSELAEAKAANEVLKEKVVAEQQAEFESKIQTLEATIAEQAEALEAKEAVVAEQAEAIAKAADDMKEKMEKLREMQKKEARMKRKAELEEAGLDAEEASATVADFEDADDDTFAKVVALMKKKGKHTPEHKEEEEEKAMKMKEEKAIKKEKEAKAEEELDSAEAGEEALEQVEPVEEVAIAELDEQEDPAESLRSVASEWLGSVLQTLPKQK
tara:strand:- start:156 stop:1619 length:1464 start_codon:yes stop_codon:yes gene_type:complete